jgi:hypothetical protein
MPGNQKAGYLGLKYFIPVPGLLPFLNTIFWKRLISFYSWTILSFRGIDVIDQRVFYA